MCVAPPSANVLARRPSGLTTASQILTALALTLLVAINLIRIVRHQMWRDELQAWRMVVESPDLLTLYAHLRFEGHPGLWHLLLWPIAQWSADPLAMQLVHAAVATGFCVLLALKAPFSVRDKALILLSYFLLFEYWVLSRNYALGVLLAFAFVWLRTSAPDRTTLAWTVLGLMTNTNVFAAIVALAMAAFMFLDRTRPWRTHVPGVVVFGVLFAVAVVTMMPAHSTLQEIAFANTGQGADSVHALRVAAWITRVFIPIHGNWPDQFWDPHFHPILRALALPVLVVGLGFIFRTDLDILALFGLAVAGILTFSYLVHTGGARQFGMMFVAFVCCLWLQRARGRALSGLAVVLLAINALAGVGAAVSAELRPFSQAAHTAQWIREQGLTDAMWIGVPDNAASAVAGHLARPFYYPSCSCERTFIRWGAGNRRSIPMPLLAAHLASVLEERSLGEAFLLLNTEISDQLEAYREGSDVLLTPLARFEGAEVPTENYVVYRIEPAPETPRTQKAAMPLFTPGPEND